MGLFLTVPDLWGAVWARGPSAIYSAPLMTLQAGSQLGPYRIVEQLGQGGMVVVDQAHDPRLDRSVAIKLLPPDLTRDETAKQRFLQEAKAASALDHPNICTIYETNETDDGQLFLVMAHYEGETLKERIARGPLPLDDTIDVATQVGEGLGEPLSLTGTSAPAQRVVGKALRKDKTARHQVTAKIGEGGMGQVHSATDTKLNRQVALKILHCLDEHVPLSAARTVG